MNKAMTRIALKKSTTKFGQALYDIANELARSSDDGNVRSYIEGGNIVFEGNYSNYLDQETIMQIVNNQGAIEGNYMYLKIPVANFKVNLPEGIVNQKRKEVTGMKNNNFSEWIDSHIHLMFSTDGLVMYLSSDPIGKVPLSGADLKRLVDSFQTVLLTKVEYDLIKGQLV